MILSERAFGLGRVVKSLYYNENCDGSAGSVIEYKNVVEGECITNSKHSWSSGDAVQFSCSSIWKLEAKMYFRNNASEANAANACDGNPGLVQTFYDNLCYKSMMYAILSTRKIYTYIHIHTHSQPGRSVRFDFDSCFLDTNNGKFIFSTMIIGFVSLALAFFLWRRTIRAKNITRSPLIERLGNAESPLSEE